MTEPAPSPEDRRQICAALVLDRVADGPSALGVFTDEELTALDGLALEQLVPMPWMADSAETVDARTAASIALRGLIARRLVLPAELLADTWEDLGDDPRRLYAVDPLEGLLTLRRGFTALLTYQRMVSEQIHTVVQYLFEQDGILEEEITSDGYHHFFVLDRATAAEHALALIDQDSVARADGEILTVRMSGIEADPEARSLIGDTRALTVASLVTRDGAAEQLTFYATSDRVAVSRSTADPTGAEQVEDPVLDFVEVSADTVRETALSLLSASEPAR